MFSILSSETQTRIPITVAIVLAALLAFPSPASRSPAPPIAALGIIAAASLSSAP